MPIVSINEIAVAVSPVPKPTSTASPSGILWRVIAMMNSTIAEKCWCSTLPSASAVASGFWSRRNRPEMRMCAWGSQASERSRKSTPSAMPSMTGSSPPASMPGMLRLVKAAASMTPAENPSAPFSMRFVGLRRT